MTELATTRITLAYDHTGACIGGEQRVQPGEMVTVTDPRTGEAVEVWRDTYPYRVEPIDMARLNEFLPGTEAALRAELAQKAKAIEAVNAFNDQLVARAENAERDAAELKATVEQQAGTIAGLREELATIKRDGEAALADMARTRDGLAATINSIVKAPADKLPDLLTTLREQIEAAREAEA